MLTAEENELLTRIGQGTPMGEVLRRYWHPVGCSEWVTTKPQRVKVLGEELVLYRGQSGRPALMQLRLRPSQRRARLRARRGRLHSLPLSRLAL